MSLSGFRSPEQLATGWDKIRLDWGVLSECCPGGPLDFIDQDDTLNWGRRLLLETLRQREADLQDGWCSACAHGVCSRHQPVLRPVIKPASAYYAPPPSWALLCNCHLCQRYKKDDGTPAVRLYLGDDNTVDDVRPATRFPSREAAVAAQLGDEAEYLVVPYPEKP